LAKKEEKDDKKVVKYGAEQISVLEGLEPVRRRPGMYIGKLGDGASYDDGIYVLIKEIIDNAVDEFIMGFGKTIEVTVKDKKGALAYKRVCADGPVFNLADIIWESWV